MVYRIRYRQADVAADREAVVEANSPAEALVKFRHAGDRRPVERDTDTVTSVRADDPGDGIVW